MRRLCLRIEVLVKFVMVKEKEKNITDEYREEN